MFSWRWWPTRALRRLEDDEPAFPIRQLFVLGMLDLVLYETGENPWLARCLSCTLLANPAQEPIRRFSRFLGWITGLD